MFAINNKEIEKVARDFFMVVFTCFVDMLKKIKDKRQEKEKQRRSEKGRGTRKIKRAKG